MGLKTIRSNNFKPKKPNLVFDLLEKVSERSRVIQKIFLSFGDLTIREYLESINPSAGVSFQNRLDLVQVVYDYTASLLGEKVAKLASLELQARPFVLTANHHGVDYFAQSVQGSLLFGLHGSLQKEKRKIIPVFSCGNIPLDNLTYPQGMLIYGLNRKYLDMIPAKLPVFPNRLRRGLVSVSAPIDSEMVERGIKQTDKLMQQHVLPLRLCNTAKVVFEEDYNSEAISGQKSYSRQATILNRFIWNRFYDQNTNYMPDILHLELEEIVTRLLKLDLKNPNSLAYNVFYDLKLRNLVVAELDQVTACWNVENLNSRMIHPAGPANTNYNTNGCGSMFFWGINSKSRRIPLKLQDDNSGNLSLVGMEDRGDYFSISFSPDAILDALKKKKLLPSLFTSFMVLAFARGVSCAGGYYQAEYLPKMQKGLIRALRKSGAYPKAVSMIQKVPTDIYLSGMQTIMTKIGLDAIVPSGPLEIIAGGGLDHDNLEQIFNLTVREAHIASLMETIPDIISNINTKYQWKNDLAVACYQILKNKAVIK